MNQTLTPALRLRTLAAAIVSSGFLASSVSAANFTWLTSPSLVGHVTTSDAFLGNGDDQVIDGINTIGAASSFTVSNGIYAFFQGSHVAQGQSIFGLQDRLLFGSNAYQSINLTGQWNLNSTFEFNQPFSQTFDPGSPSFITINHDQSYTDSFVMHDTLSGGRVRAEGTGHYLLRSQVPTTLYSGDLLGHFNFVTPLLPNNWNLVAQETLNVTVLDGPNAGGTAVNTLTFYSQDGLSNPGEQPLALGAPWVTTGYAALNGNAAQIGSFAPPDGPGGDGTAMLSAGNTATLGGLGIGGGGPNGGAGGVTIEGLGTQLDFGKRLSVSDNGTLNVINGAQVSTGAGGQHLSFGDIHVSGAGSELAIQCNSGPPACSVFGTSINGFFPLDGSNTVIDSGARLVVDGGGHTEITGIGVIGQFNPNISAVPTLTVDGLGSEIHIGGGSTTAVRGRTGLAVDVGAILNVTDGGKIVVDKLNIGLTGIFIGSRSPTSPDVSQIIVDGNNSLIDGGTTLSVGEAEAMFNTVTQQYERTGAAGGASLLVVRNGAVAMADDIIIGPNGTVKGSGGTLQGDVENNGTIAPGESPGTLTIQGDLVQAADGKLVIEIGGSAPGSFDVLNVSGKFTLGGTLEIDLVNGFTPGANDVFDFLQVGSFEGSFANFILPTFGNGQTLHLNLGPNGISAVSAVPVPAAVWLLGSALGGIGFIRRRTF